MRRALRRNDLVTSVRGPGGGYQVEQALEDISVSQIITAVGDGVDATRCHGTGDCQDGHMCLTHDLWSDLSGEIDGFLTNISLADLVGKKEVQGVASRQEQRLIHARHL